MTCEERAPLIFLHAAGVLDGEERDALEAHLRDGCERCESERAAAESTLASLSLGLEPVQPSPELREHLLARVAGAAAPAARVAGGWGLALAAGIAAVIAAGVTLAAFERLTANPLREKVAQLEAENRALAERHAELGAQLAEQGTLLEEQDDELAALERAAGDADEVLAFLRSPGVEVMTLAGSRQPEATARVFWEWEDYGCYLHASGLAPPAAGGVYVLWLFTEHGAWVRAGEFQPDAGGEAAFFTRLPSDTGRVQRALVSEEPDAAAEEPAGEVQLSGRRV